MCIQNPGGTFLYLTGVFYFPPTPGDIWHFYESKVNESV